MQQGLLCRQSSFSSPSGEAVSVSLGLRDTNLSSSVWQSVHTHGITMCRSPSFSPSNPGQHHVTWPANLDSLSNQCQQCRHRNFMSYGSGVDDDPAAVTVGLVVVDGLLDAVQPVYRSVVPFQTVLLNPTGFGFAGVTGFTSVVVAADARLSSSFRQ